MGTLWPTSAIYSISCQYKLQISTSTLYFVTILMLYCIARCTTYLYYNAIWGLGIFCWSFLFLKHPFLKNLYFMGTFWPTLAIYSISCQIIYNILDISTLYFVTIAMLYCTARGKGQLISKCLFGVFDFLQETNENKST